MAVEHSSNDLIAKSENKLSTGKQKKAGHINGQLYNLKEVRVFYD